MSGVENCRFNVKFQGSISLSMVIKMDQDLGRPMLMDCIIPVSLINFALN